MTKTEISKRLQDAYAAYISATDVAAAAYDAAYAATAATAATAADAAYVATAACDDAYAIAKDAAAMYRTFARGSHLPARRSGRQQSLARAGADRGKRGDA